MKKSFNKIPLQLQNAVIGFGGSFPGVGKSYTRKHWAKKLRALGYQVIETGSTNKASEGNKTIYSVADWTDMKATRAKKGFVRKQEGKIYSQKSAVIMVDEAWMLSQEDIEKLRKQFPKCCIMIFGDPNQFPPIEDKSLIKVVDEMSPYQEAIMEIRKAVAKGIERKSIYDVDLMFNLTVQHRIDTPDLRRFLANVKQGWADQEDAIVFMEKHQPKEDFDFAICRTWQCKNGVDSYKGKGNGVFVGQNNIGAVKNALYDMKGHSYESDSQITDMSLFTDERNYKLQGAVTCHSIQGTTLNKGTKVLIDFDDAMCLIDENNTNDRLLEDFARFVYVACSRVQDEDDLYVKCDNVKKFLKIMGYHVGLSCDMKGYETDSEKLCCCDNPIEFLLSKEEIQNRVVKERPKANPYESLVTWISRFSSIIIPSYNIKNLYNSVTWNNANVLTKCKFLKISPNTYCKYKKWIEESFRLICERPDLLKDPSKIKPEPRVFTCGKTIGEIMAEEELEEQQKNDKESMILNFESNDLYTKNADKVTKEWWSKKSKEDKLEAFDYLLDFLKQEYIQREVLVNHRDVDEVKNEAKNIFHNQNIFTN